MGRILDSSLFIAAERRRETLREIFKRVQAAHGETEAGLSVVTIVELTHGIYRAKSDADGERRRAFVEEICRDMVVHPVTLEIAQLAGRIEGEQEGPRIQHRVRRPTDRCHGVASRVLCCNAQRTPL